MGDLERTGAGIHGIWYTPDPVYGESSLEGIRSAGDPVCSGSDPYGIRYVGDPAYTGSGLEGIRFTWILYIRDLVYRGIRYIQGLL